MKSGTVLLASAVPFTILLAVACSPTLETADPVVERFLGDSLLRVIADAETTWAYRLLPGVEGYVSTPPGSLPDSVIVTYRILSRGPRLTPEEMRALRRALYSRSTYVFDDAKECVPTPGVGFRFVRGSGRVDVALCFECLMWMFSDDRNSTSEEFDGSALSLFDLAEEIFPDLEQLPGLRKKAVDYLRFRRH